MSIFFTLFMKSSTFSLLSPMLLIYISVLSSEYIHFLSKDIQQSFKHLLIKNTYISFGGKKTI